VDGVFPNIRFLNFVSIRSVEIYEYIK